MSEYSEDFEDFEDVDSGADTSKDTFEDAPDTDTADASDFDVEDTSSDFDNAADDEDSTDDSEDSVEDDEDLDEDDDWDQDDDDIEAVKQSSGKGGIADFVKKNKTFSIAAAAIAAVVVLAAVTAITSNNNKKNAAATATTAEVSSTMASTGDEDDQADSGDEALDKAGETAFVSTTAHTAQIATEASVAANDFTQASSEQSDAIKSLQDSISGLQDSMDTVKSAAAKSTDVDTSGLESKISSLSSKVSSLQSSVGSLKSTGNDTSAIDSLKSQVSSLKSAIDTLSKQTPTQDAATKASLSALTTQMGNIVSQLNDLATKNSKTNETYSALSEKIAELSKEQVSASSDTANSIKSLTNDISKSLSALEGKISANETNNTDTASDLAELKKSLSSLSAKVDTLNTASTPSAPTTTTTTGADGSTTTKTTYSDGTTIERTTKSDGTVATTVKDKNGNVISSNDGNNSSGTKSDNTTTTTNSDGSKTTETKNPNGSSVKTTEEKNGTTVTEIKDENGNTVTKTTVTKGSDGSVTTVTENPDGSTTTTVKKPDGSTTTKTTGGNNKGSGAEVSDIPKDHWTAAYSEKTGLTYNGAEQTGVTAENCVLNGVVSATDATKGDKTYFVAAEPATGYAWADGTTGMKKITWKISPAAVVLPTGRALPFNDEAQLGFNTTGITLSDENKIADEKAFVSDDNTEANPFGPVSSAVNAGFYKTAVIPDNNHVWNDNTDAAKEVVWSISRVKPEITVSGDGVKDNEIKAYAIENSDGTVSGEDSYITINVVGDENITASVAEGSEDYISLIQTKKDLTITPKKILKKDDDTQPRITIHVDKGTNTDEADATFPVSIERLYSVSISSLSKGLVLTAESDDAKLTRTKTASGTTEYSGIFHGGDKIHTEVELVSDAYEFKGWSNGETGLTQDIKVKENLIFTANAAEKITSTDTTKDTTSSQTGSTGYKVSIYKNGTEGRPTITANVFELYKNYTIKDAQDTYESPNSFYCATDPTTAKYVVYGYKMATSPAGSLSLTEVSSKNAPVSYKDQSKLDIDEEENGKKVWTALGLLRSGKYDKDTDTYTVEYFTSDLTSNTATVVSVNATSAQNCYIALVPINTYTEAETTEGYNVELYKRGTISERPTVYSIEEVAGKYTKDNLYKDSSLSKYALYIYGNSPEQIATDGKTGFTTADATPVFDADSSAWTLVGKIKGAETNSSGGTSVLYFTDNNGSIYKSTYAFKNDERADHFIALVPIASPRVVDTAKGDNTDEGTVSVYPYGDFTRQVVVGTWKDIAENYSKGSAYYAKDSSDAQYALYTYKTRTKTKPTFDYGENWGNWTLQGRYSRGDDGDKVALHYFTDQTNGFKTDTVATTSGEEKWAALVPVENYTEGLEVDGNSSAYANYQYLDLYKRGTNAANVIVTDLATADSYKTGFTASEAENAPYAAYIYKSGTEQNSAPSFDADSPDWALYGIYKDTIRSVEGVGIKYSLNYFTELGGTSSAEFSRSTNSGDPSKVYIALVPRRVKYLEIKDQADTLAWDIHSDDWKETKLVGTIISASKTTSESAISVNIDVTPKKNMTFNDEAEIVKPVTLKEEEEEEIKVYATPYNRHKVWDTFGNDTENVKDGILTGQIVFSLIAPDSEGNAERTYVTTTTTIKEDITEQSISVTTLGSIIKNGKIGTDAPGYDLGSGAKVFGSDTNANITGGGNDGKIKIAVLSVDEENHTAVCLPYGVGGSAWNNILGSGVPNSDGKDLTDTIGPKVFGDLYNKDPAKSAISNVKLISGADEGSVNKNATSEIVTEGGNGHTTTINVLASGASSYTSFGASYGYFSWLGTPYDGSDAYYVNSSAGVDHYNHPSCSCVLAPSFNLDLSKVWIINGEIVLCSYTSE